MLELYDNGLKLNAYCLILILFPPHVYCGQILKFRSQDHIRLTRQDYLLLMTEFHDFTEPHARIKFTGPLPAGFLDRAYPKLTTLVFEDFETSVPLLIATHAHLFPKLDTLVFNDRPDEDKFTIEAPERPRHRWTSAHAAEFFRRTGSFPKLKFLTLPSIYDEMEDVFGEIFKDIVYETRQEYEKCFDRLPEIGEVSFTLENENFDPRVVEFVTPYNDFFINGVHIDYFF